MESILHTTSFDGKNLTVTFDIKFPQELKPIAELLISKEIPEMEAALIDVAEDYMFDCEIRLDIVNRDYSSDCCIEVEIGEETWTSYFSINSRDEPKMTPILNSRFSFSQYFVQEFSAAVLNFYLKHREYRMKYVYTTKYLQKVLDADELVKAYGITDNLQLLPKEVRETFLF